MSSLITLTYEIFKSNPEVSKKDFVNLLVNEYGLAPNTAGSYHYKFKKKFEAEPTAAKPVQVKIKEETKIELPQSQTLRYGDVVEYVGTSSMAKKEGKLGKKIKAKVVKVWGNNLEVIPLYRLEANAMHPAVKTKIFANNVKKVA